MTPSTIAAGDRPIGGAPATAKNTARDLGHGIHVTAEHGRVIHHVTG